MEEIFPPAVHPWGAEVKPSPSRRPLFTFETLPAAPSLSSWPHWSWRKELKIWMDLALAVPHFASLWEREGEEKGVHGHLELAQSEKGCSIIESCNGLGWKGPYRSSSSNPPAMGRDTFY